MQITVFKCEQTGALFEDEKDFKKHKRGLATQAAFTQKRAAVKTEMALVAEKTESVRSVQELMELANRYGQLQNSFKGDDLFKGIRLAQVSVAGRDAMALQARIILFQGSQSSFGFDSQSFNGLPGFKLNSGHGIPVPGDAPEGSRKCMEYTASFEFDKLKGLAQTRDEIVAARQAETNHFSDLQTRADELLYAESISFRELQEEAAKLEAELDSLRERTETYRRRKDDVVRNIHTAVAAKKEELKQIHREPTERKLALEAMMAVGSV